jgi:hypothetical protein
MQPFPNAVQYGSTKKDASVRDHDIKEPTERLCGGLVEPNDVHHSQQAFPPHHMERIEQNSQQSV